MFLEHALSASTRTAAMVKNLNKSISLVMWVFLFCNCHCIFDISRIYFFVLSIFKVSLRPRIPGTLLTDSTENCPIAVSALSMTASAPSSRRCSLGADPRLQGQARGSFARHRRCDCRQCHAGEWWQCMDAGFPCAYTALAQE